MFSTNYFFFLFQDSFARLDDRFDKMQAVVTQKLLGQGISKDRIDTECYLHLRYEGTDCALMCTSSPKKSGSICTRHGDFTASFLNR